LNKILQVFLASSAREVRRKEASAYLRLRTWPRWSASTRTRFYARFGSFGKRVYWSFAAVAASAWPAAQSAEPSSLGRELVEFARKQGYGRDDLVRLIERIG
jgi:hypothetical protein